MITLQPVRGIPEVTAGTDLGATIVAALAASDLAVRPGDILVVTSKIVSKAEGLFVDGDDRAALTLRESRAVVTERATPGGPTRVVAALAGPVMAGAGIDASNAGDDRLLLLPKDPDDAAARVHASIAGALTEPVPFGVVLSDTAGRPWRTGLTDFALGLHALTPVDDLRGRPDTEGRDLAVTVRCLADEIAAAADLVKGKLDHVPVALVRGLGALVADDPAGVPAAGARDLVRTGPDDWFSMGRAEAVRSALGIEPGSPVSERVGLESVLPEPVTARIERAVRVALCRGDEAMVRADPADAADVRAGVEVDLSCQDPVTLGRVWARLEVALAGERLAVADPARDGQTVHLRVYDAAEPSVTGTDPHGDSQTGPARQAGKGKGR